MPKWVKLMYDNPFFYRKSKFSAKYKVLTIKSALRTDKAFSFISHLNRISFRNTTTVLVICYR